MSGLIYARPRFVNTKTKVTVENITITIAITKTKVTVENKVLKN